MAVTVACPKCEREYTVPDTFVGQTMRCKKCGQSFRTVDDDNPPPPGRRARVLFLVLGGLGLFLFAVAGVLIAVSYLTRKPDTKPAAPATPVAAADPTPTPKAEAPKPDPPKADPPKPNPPKPELVRPAPPPAAADPLPPADPPKKVARPDPPPPPPAPPPRKPDTRSPLERIDVRLPTDWTAAFDKDSKSWVYEKETPGAKTEINRLRLAELPGDPGPADAYAAKLKQKDFVDPGSVFTEVTQKRKLPDGFLITGVVANHKDPTEKPRLGLVMVRKVGDLWLTLSSTSLRKDGLRQEAVELFQSAKAR
jgi:outer membrane biosynthesis protein TonB